MVLLHIALVPTSAYWPPLQEAGAALQERDPLADDVTTGAPPPHTPSEGMQHLSNPVSNAPSTAPQLAKLRQRTKSRSEPLALQRASTAWEHKHSEHAFPQCKGSWACEVLDSFTGYSVRRSASFNSLSSVPGRGGVECAERLPGEVPAARFVLELGLPAQVLQDRHYTAADTGAGQSTLQPLQQAVAAIRAQEDTIDTAASSVTPQPPLKQSPKTSQHRRTTQYVADSAGSAASDQSPCQTPPATQALPSKQRGSTAPCQRYISNLSTFSNQWHTGAGPRPGSSELAASSYAPCSTVMSLRGTHSLNTAPQISEAVPFAQKCPADICESLVATGGSVGRRSHTPSPSNSSNSRASIGVPLQELRPAARASSSLPACACTHQQPCMREECERCRDWSCSKQCARAVDSLAGGGTDLREAMAKLQDAFHSGAWVEDVVLPVHKLLAPVRVCCACICYLNTAAFYGAVVRALCAVSCDSLIDRLRYRLSADYIGD